MSEAGLGNSATTINNRFPMFAISVVNVGIFFCVNSCVITIYEYIDAKVQSAVGE